MSPELIDKIKDALEPVAEMAEQGAEYAWATLVRQVFIQGVVSVVVGVVLVVVATVLLRTCTRYRHKHLAADDWREREALGVTAVLSGIASTGIALIASIQLVSGTMRLLNPGYYAMEQIARLAGV